jgi:hypothetical protein
VTQPRPPGPQNPIKNFDNLIVAFWVLFQVRKEK